MLGRIFTTLEGLLREGRANLAAVDSTGNISFVREDDDVDSEDEDGQNAYDADAMDTVRCLLCMELVIVAVVGLFFVQRLSLRRPFFSLCAVGVQDGATAKGYTDLFMEEELVPSSSSEDDEADSVLED
jgi:hypothetical protein